MANNHHSMNRGVSLLEVVVGVSIVLISLMGLSATLPIYTRYAAAQPNAVAATMYLEEGAEAVRALRDDDWSAFAAFTTGEAYYLAWDGALWEATTTAVLLDDTFVRTFTLFPAYRNGSQDLALSGTEEPNMRQVEVEVSWEGSRGERIESTSFYLANLFE